MVAAWGSIARSRRLNDDNVVAYTQLLVERYRNRPNIVWITGGDTQGDRETSVWRKMGETFRKLDPNHLITYHPFGRTQSSTWFHNEPWMDFNMFQSGHRRYDQDTTPGAKGEDNWKYVLEDYAKTAAQADDRRRAFLRGNSAGPARPEGTALGSERRSPLRVLVGLRGRGGPHLWPQRRDADAQVRQQRVRQQEGLVGRHRRSRRRADEASEKPDALAAVFRAGA